MDTLSTDNMGSLVAVNPAAVLDDDTTMKNTASTSTSLVIAQDQSTKVFDWEKLPTELREQIFEFTDTVSDRVPHFEWRGRLPALVVALRSLPISHAHVLEWVKKYNRSLRLTDWFGFNLADWNKDELSVIEFVWMDVSSIEEKLLKKIETDGGLEWEFQRPTWFTKPFLDMTNLTSVYLWMNLDISRARPDFITEFPFWLEGCTALKLLQVELPVNKLDRVTDKKRDALIMHMMKKIRKRTGVLGVLDGEIEYTMRIGSEKAELWRWEATLGQRMNWAQEIGMQWWGPNYHWSWPKPWSFFDSVEFLVERGGELYVDYAEE